MNKCITLFAFFIGNQIQAQNPHRIDSLYHEYTWYVNAINSEIYYCGDFFIIQDNPICENLERLESHFLFFRKRSEITIELYEEFLKIKEPSVELLLEADSTITYHTKGIHLIDSTLLVFHEKCTF